MQQKTLYYMIPLRAPNGMPPRYVAISSSTPPVDQRDQQQQQQQRRRRHVSSPTEMSAVGSSSKTIKIKDEPSSHHTDVKKTTSTKVAAKVAEKPNKPTSLQLNRRVRSVPLQEMRESVLALRDNARCDTRDQSGNGSFQTNNKKKKDNKKEKAYIEMMPADDLHPLKYWEV